jgi:hypothetical protein
MVAAVVDGMCQLNLMLVIKHSHGMQLKRNKYPTIFKIVLDILAIPASAVPPEEAFSSARRTTTWERNWLSPDLIRSLQLFKHNNRNFGRLEKRSLWAYTEEDMNAISAGMGENGVDEYLDDE